MKWEAGKSSTRMYHGVGPLSGLMKRISELSRKAPSISLRLALIQDGSTGVSYPTPELIFNQRDPRGLSKSSIREVSGQEVRGTCQGVRAVLSDYTCTKLHKACVELVTAAMAGVRDEVKRIF